MSTSSSSDGASRLNLLKGVAVAGVGLAAVGSSVADANTSTPTSAGKLTVDRLLTKDGTSLYFKDWGSGPAVVFSHGSSRSMPPAACSGSPFWSGLILKRKCR